MKYQKIIIGTTPEYEDIIAATLAEMDINEIEIDDGLAVEDEYAPGFYPELQPDAEPDAGCRVSFYTDIEEDTAALISQIKDELSFYGDESDIIPGGIASEIVDEDDWKDNWKQYFHSFNVGDIFICPSWEDVPEDHEGDTLVRIDPGMSFGTGAHESTRLIIRQMKKYITPESKVLDMGCGSGILSIVAAKIGSTDITGVDIDPDCLISTQENLDKNDVPRETYKLYAGDITSDDKLAADVGEGYDVVLCNILADIIAGMLPRIAVAIKKGGVLITSGIINFKEEMIKEALVKEGFDISDVLYDGEWVSVTAVKQ